MSVDSHIRLGPIPDDCLIFRKINSLEDKLQLQKYIDSLEDWAVTRVYASTNDIATFNYYS